MNAFFEGVSCKPIQIDLNFYAKSAEKFKKMSRQCIGLYGPICTLGKCGSDGSVIKSEGISARDGRAYQVEQIHDSSLGGSDSFGNHVVAWGE
mmetsp:Transcript_12815/g.32759  ORF Transcript_12815/g.32759 Transcript_12815/m.32759 type:complete len:93 (+) Transcript_12815:577-855(+)